MFCTDPSDLNYVLMIVIAGISINSDVGLCSNVKSATKARRGVIKGPVF